jgi:hypothetical protein
VSIDRKRAKAGKLVDQAALRTVERVELKPHMWSANQRGGLRKALKSDVLANVRSIATLHPSDLNPLRKARATTVTDLTLELPESVDLDALAAELAHWTALQSLQLELPPSLIEGGAPPIAVLLGRLPIAAVTVSLRNPQGHSVSLGRLAAAAHPETQHVAVVPSYRTVLRTERQGGRFSRATFVIEPPEHGRPPLLSLGAWMRARTEFDVAIDGSLEAVTTRAADLQALPALRGETETLTRVEVRGPVSPEQLAFDEPLPDIRTLVLETAEVGPALLAAVDAVEAVRDLELPAGRMRIRRGGSGRLDRCTLEWYRWRDRGSLVEMLARLAPSLRAVDWRHGDRPAALDAFLEGARGGE